MTLMFHGNPVEGTLDLGIQKITQAEYDALPEAEKLRDDIQYLITDSNVLPVDNYARLDETGKVAARHLPKASQISYYDWDTDDEISVAERIEQLEQNVPYLEYIYVTDNTKETYQQNETFDPTTLTVYGVLKLGDAIIKEGVTIPNNEVYLIEPTDFSESLGNIQVTIGYRDQKGREVQGWLGLEIIEPFSWANGQEATTSWWKGLKAEIQGKSDAELAQYLGKTVSVTIPFTITGFRTYDNTSNTHLLRCIGYNCDHDVYNVDKNTLTFQTADCLENSTIVFNGSSLGYYNDGVWNTSFIKLRFCFGYRDAFESTYGNGVIITCSKGTCEAVNSEQAGTPYYRNETVFLPSDCEMGFQAGKDADNGKGYSSSYSEYDQYNLSNTPYQYYTTNESRIKRINNTSRIGYCERSLAYSTNVQSGYVDADGKPGTALWADSHGFAPAFAI